MKTKLYILLLLIILTGCTATYNLEITTDGFYEQLEINATTISEKEELWEFPYPIYYDAEGNNEDPTKKADDTEYYNSSLVENNDSKILIYDYLFQENEIKKSGIIKSSFDTFILKKYDYDDDGINDYMLISTTDDFNRFKIHSKLESVTINIKCHYEVISSNADEVNKNVYTWYLNRNDIKPINMVYNPDKVIDYRNLWEKIKEGEYTNIFTISILLFIVGMILYLVLKRKSKNRDKI